MADRKLRYTLTFEALVSSDEEEAGADALIKTTVANNMPASVNLVFSQKETQRLTVWNF